MYRIVEWRDGGIVHEEKNNLVGFVNRYTIQGKVVYVFQDDDDNVVIETNSIAEGFAAFAKHHMLHDDAEPDGDCLWVERRLGELMADTSQAMMRGAVEHKKRGGKLRPETQQNAVDLIMRLYGTWSISLRGSYDSACRCFVPYFLAEDGSRLIFGTAARHYGEIALRKRLPHANVAKLREVLSWPLECLRSLQDAIRREDGDPTYPQATEAEMQELEDIFTGVDA